MKRDPADWAALAALLATTDPMLKIGLWSLQEKRTPAGYLYEVRLYSGDFDRARVRHIDSTELDAISPRACSTSLVEAATVCLASWSLTQGIPAHQGLSTALSRLSAALGDAVAAWKGT